MGPVQSVKPRIGQFVTLVKRLFYPGGLGFIGDKLPPCDQLGDMRIFLLHTGNLLVEIVTSQLGHGDFSLAPESGPLKAGLVRSRHCPVGFSRSDKVRVPEKIRSPQRYVDDGRSGPYQSITLLLHVWVSSFRVTKFCSCVAQHIICSFRGCLI